MSLGVGLVGYGYAGKTFHAPLIAATPGLALAAVASRHAEEVEARWPGVVTTPDPAALIARADVDLVVVATPNDTHEPLARAALEAGKAVVVDKPFTLDLEQARDLMELAARRNRLLSVFHNRRWDSDFLGVRRAVDDGLVGRVSHFESHFDRYRPLVRDRWRERGGPGAGIWFDLGPHLVDQALELFGLPDTIQADLAAQRTGAQADDWAHVVLRYDGLRVVLHADMLAADGGVRFVVRGDKGALRKSGADQQETQLLAGMTPGAPGWGEDPDPLVLFDGEGNRRPLTPTSGDQRAYYAGVRDAVLGIADNPVASVQALAVMAVIDAATAAARAGAVSDLALTAEERRAYTAARRPRTA